MKRRRVGIYILLEGFGAQFLRTQEFLPEFEYRAGLRSVLGDGCAAQASLLSGELPRTHGFGTAYPRHEGASVFDAARKFAWLPEIIADRSAIREQIRGQVGLDTAGVAILEHCPTRLLPQFDLVDSCRFFELGGLGSCRSVFDGLPGRGLSFRIYPGSSTEHEDFTGIEEDLSRGDVDFVFLRLASLGQLLRNRGSAADILKERLRWVESWIRRLHEAAESVADVAELFVFSDRGTSDVHGGVDLVSAVHGEFGRNGRHYLAFYGPTMARFWCKDPELRHDLVDFLGERTEGRRIPREEQELLGWEFEDRREGDELFVLNEGLQVVPNFLGDSMRAAMSGYHPDALGSDAMILGLWSPSEELRHVSDLYRLMNTTAERLTQE